MSDTIKRILYALPFNAAVLTLFWAYLVGYEARWLDMLGNVVVLLVWLIFFGSIFAFAVSAYLVNKASPRDVNKNGKTHAEEFRDKVKPRTALQNAHNIAIVGAFAAMGWWSVALAFAAQLVLMAWFRDIVKSWLDKHAVQHAEATV